MEILLEYLWVLVIIILAVCYKYVLRFFGVIVIPNDVIGIVNKRFVIFGI